MHTLVDIQSLSSTECTDVVPRRCSSAESRFHWMSSSMYQQRWDQECRTALLQLWSLGVAVNTWTAEAISIHWPGPVRSGCSQSAASIFPLSSTILLSHTCELHVLFHRHHKSPRSSSCLLLPASASSYSSPASPLSGPLSLASFPNVPTCRRPFDLLISGLFSSQKSDLEAAAMRVKPIFLLWHEVERVVLAFPRRFSTIEQINLPKKVKVAGKGGISPAERDWRMSEPLAGAHR